MVKRLDVEIKKALKTLGVDLKEIHFYGDTITIVAEVV